MAIEVGLGRGLRLLARAVPADRTEALPGVQGATSSCGVCGWRSSAATAWRPTRGASSAGGVLRADAGARAGAGRRRRRCRG